MTTISNTASDAVSHTAVGDESPFSQRPDGTSAFGRAVGQQDTVNACFLISGSAAYLGEIPGLRDIVFGSVRGIMGLPERQQCSARRQKDPSRIFHGGQEFLCFLDQNIGLMILPEKLNPAFQKLAEFRKIVAIQLFASSFITTTINA